MWDQSNYDRNVPPSAQQTATLKICPLCDTAIPQLSKECYMCGWHGAFFDATPIEEPRDAICDELEDAIEMSERRVTQRQRIKNFLRRFFWPD